MTKETFSLVFDGEAVQNHEMDVALLAPALMGLSDLVDLLAKSVTQGEFSSKLKVQGNPKAGSIEIQFITESLINHAVNLFTGKNVTAILAVAALIDLLVKLISLIKETGGKPAQVVSEDVKNQLVTLKIENELLIVERDIARAYSQIAIRQALYQTVKPLQDEGIDRLKIKDSSGRVVAEVRDTELASFEPNIEGEDLLSNTATVLLQIMALNFSKPKNKWTFFNGNNQIKAEILDDDFWKQVNNGIRFGKGDWIKVQLKTRQMNEGGKLKTVYEVIKVEDGDYTPDQQSLDI